MTALPTWERPAAVRGAPPALADRPASSRGPDGPVSCLGAAVLGLGIGQQHLMGWQCPPECDVVSICDTSVDKLRAVAGRCTGATVTARWQDVLADDRVDIVSIATFDDAHCEQTLAALAAGRHVFVEKPLCRSRWELALIQAALRRHPRQKLGSNLVLRAAPAYQWLRSAIQDGVFGEIYAFDGDYLYGRIHKITEGWRKDVEHYSVLQGGGIHLVDLMLWLTDQLPAAVSAQGNRISTRETAFRYHDYVAATYTFPSGLIGRITANFGCVHRHQHVVRVFGTKATFVHDDQGPRWFPARDDCAPATRVDAAPLPAAKWGLIPGFLMDVRAGRCGPADAQREFDTLSVCFAADESLTTGAPREVEYS